MTQYIGRDTAIKTAIEMCVKVAGHGITQIDAVDIAQAFEDIPTADVVPKSEVEKIFEEIEKIIQSAYYVDELGEWHDETLILGGIDELKKKCAEEDNE